MKKYTDIVLAIILTVCFGIWLYMAHASPTVVQSTSLSEPSALATRAVNLSDVSFDYPTDVISGYQDPETNDWEGSLPLYGFGLHATVENEKALIASGGGDEWNPKESWANYITNSWQEEQTALTQPVGPVDCPNNGPDCSIYINKNGIKMLVSYGHSSQEIETTKMYTFFQNDQRYTIGLTVGDVNSADNWNTAINKDGIGPIFQNIIDSIHLSN